MLEQSKFIRNPDFIYRRVVEDMILVPIHQDVADMECIYTLNEVGAFIWEKLDQPASLADLRRAVLEEYAEEPAQVEKDLEDFLNTLTEFGAVTQA